MFKTAPGSGPGAVQPKGKLGPMPTARLLTARRLLPTSRLLLGALILLAAGCAGSGSQPAASAASAGSGETPVTIDERRLLRFYGILDEDGSGAISRPEFQSGKGSVFMAMDADGSMTLTPNETKLTPEAFGALAGADGMVDGQEFLAADIAQFDKIDTNRDLEITYEELRDYLQKLE